MYRSLLFAAASILTFSGAASAKEESTDTCYELRTYYASEGKLEALHARFRNDTLRLFAKHHMKSIGYWVPIDNKEQKLVYLLSFPDRETRDKAWDAFHADQEWIDAKAKSEENGVLIDHLTDQFLTPTDFSTVTYKPADKPHTFELRTYTATEGNLPNLLTRFRDHTVSIFTRCGMEHFHYFTPMKGEPGADQTLVYFLAHASPEARNASWQKFGSDPEWVKALKESEANAGGSLTVPNGVKSELLTPTDYSPVQ
ncbi:NIPSNAP family protein [Luteolibacter pohnpeiensis]|uniref:NIPSNAP family protein n=1 Tax=Luteolibacter pohnpeiensis TaxID=454153 RepID=A0A934VSC4_9BACT|nr:NIPSNAP family protein [Luteolibacter pohnpeiensis]MBK1884151.1 NIPSNAP family protein [Luteolibacter pohnpeiensis]